MIKPELKEWTHIVRPGATDCRYRDYLVAGATLIGYVTDCLACFSIAREGTSGLVANVNCNFRDEVHAMDELIVTLKIERIGNTSRTYSFTIHKDIEFPNGGSYRTELLDEPRLVADGTLVLVVRDHG